MTGERRWKRTGKATPAEKKDRGVKITAMIVVSP